MLENIQNNILSHILIILIFLRDFYCYIWKININLKSGKQNKTLSTDRKK